jgi:hypothetical protein
MQEIVLAKSCTGLTVWVILSTGEPPQNGDFMRFFYEEREPDLESDNCILQNSWSTRLPPTGVRCSSSATYSCTNRPLEFSPEPVVSCQVSRSQAMKGRASPRKYCCHQV